MELTEEIRALFAEGAEHIKEVELTYRNGGKVKGKIRKLRLGPFRLSIQKNAPAPGERRRHRAVLEHVTALVLHMQDGRRLRFEEEA